MNSEKYLRQEGLKPFVGPDRFLPWAKKRIGEQNLQQFFNYMNQRATGVGFNDPGFYDFISDPKISTVANSFEHGLVNHILNWVEPRLPAEGIIVELGCHTGLLARYYAYARPNAQIFGLDHSTEAIQAAQTLAQEKNIENLSFHKADLCQDDHLPFEKADCIISGRVLSELMTSQIRLQESWQHIQYPPRQKELDQGARKVLQLCAGILNTEGRLLLTERFINHDRLNRLWLLTQEAGFTNLAASLAPIEWKDVAGEHRTWFYESKKDLRTPRSATEISPYEVPLPSREAELVNDETRVMVKGLMALQTWYSLNIQKKIKEGLLRWNNGAEVHFEIGTASHNLGYTFIASNTGLQILTLFLPFEADSVKEDLEEYILQLTKEGAKLIQE